jgi:prepilin peptidase CpaA
MNHATFSIWYTVLMILLIGSAMTTDLLWRRIPNYLTFTAFAVALAVRLVLHGWAGIAFGLAGALIAPVLLWLLHGGRRLGMGDMKLAMAVGAIIGPASAIPAMFLSTLVGGIIAIYYLLIPGGLLNQFFGIFLIGTLFRRKGTPLREEVSRPVIHTMPYGLAIGMGSLITLAVCWWTGNETWFFSFVGIVVNP